jgi:hypothetical protein
VVSGAAESIVRGHQNTAGIYGTVTRIDRLAIGQSVLLRAASDKREGTLRQGDPIELIDE